MHFKTPVAKATLVTLATLFLFYGTSEGNIDEVAEAGARALLERYQSEAAKLYNKVSLMSWAYVTNITEHNKEAKAEASLEASKFQGEMYEQSSRYRAISDTLSPETQRMLRLAFPAKLEEEDQKNLTQLGSIMSEIYSTGTVCLHNDQESEECLNLEPDLTKLLATSRNYTLLAHIWESWRTNVARKIRPHYLQYVELKNKGAQLNGRNDYGEQLRMKYETETFEDDILELYKELDPLYRLVHAYVRKKLYNLYCSSEADILNNGCTSVGKWKMDQYRRADLPRYGTISKRGPLPGCILGDMWGRFWTNLYPEIVPYPDQPDIDVTQAMIDQNYNVTHMFRMANEFFTSMGMKPVVDSFWSKSMLERPEGRQVECHATAWDFYDGLDFRIRMCSTVNFEDFETIHHELGHIQYFMQYAHLPLIYRDGANDGFHEAVGELMAMSMSTPTHLAEIGLLKESPNSTETDINFLLRTALKTITTLPFHLVNDLWRWRAFRGDYKDGTWNKHYWDLKEEYLGVIAPVPRTKDDLDAPSIFHIVNDYDMIRYFTRTVLLFQFYEKLCEVAGHRGPLHKCDFYGSKEAGEILSKMLSLGASKPWWEVLEVMTGEKRMSARALLDYFKPLEEWLKEDNRKSGDGIGWGDSWRSLDDISAASSTDSSVLNLCVAITLFYSLSLLH
ncbi:angiotensin-converting enzyme-like [Macrobrachium nipponense]|uniref:angiotensin-converting enzyme-like n=1 Tax=Macrobrachium nipponense TaxID=159736 RepID=UPI0030C870C6